MNKTLNMHLDQAQTAADGLMVLTHIFANPGKLPPIESQKFARLMREYADEVSEHINNAFEASRASKPGLRIV